MNRASMTQEGWLTQLISSLSAAAVGYGATALAKAKPGSPWAVATEGGLFAAATVTRNLVNHPMLYDAMEAVQYGSAALLGNWVAEITTTPGGRGPGAPAPWLPSQASATPASSSSGTSSSTGTAALVQPLQPAPAPTQIYRYQRRAVAY